jgi:ribosomal protein L44E
VRLPERRLRKARLVTAPNPARVTKVSEKMHVVVNCDSCGPLKPPTDAVARRHALRHPDHFVGMSHVVQASYFVRRGAA